VLVLPRNAAGGVTRELVYTGITRARTAFTLVTGRAATLAEALKQPTRRASGLQERLEKGTVAD
jgi:exodeoxyribonuclease V alpha subunit